MQSHGQRCCSWWRHQMETFSALLAICAGNSPVPGEFPTQRPVTRRFGVFFDLRLNKRLNKQPRGWWFETPSRSLWRHSNGMFSIDVAHPSCPCAGCAHQAFLGVRPGRVCLYNSAPCKRSITTNIAPGSRHLNWHFCCFLSQCTYTCYFIQ